MGNIVKSDVVLVIAMICLTLLGIASSFAFSEGVAKILVGGAIGIIAAICGVSYHVTMRDMKSKRENKL